MCFGLIYLISRGDQAANKLLYFSLAIFSCNYLKSGIVNSIDYKTPDF